MKNIKLVLLATTLLLSSATFAVNKQKGSFVEYVVNDSSVPVMEKPIAVIPPTATNPTIVSETSMSNSNVTAPIVPLKRVTKPILE